MLSTDLEEIELIDPMRIAEFVGTLQPVRVEGSETADWSWSAIFESDRSLFQLNMTLLEAENGEPMWGGFSLQGDAAPEDLSWLAGKIKEAFGGVWIHDDQCRMYAPEEFSGS